MALPLRRHYRINYVLQKSTECGGVDVYSREILFRSPVFVSTLQFWVKYASIYAVERRTMLLYPNIIQAYTEPNDATALPFSIRDRIGNHLPPGHHRGTILGIQMVRPLSLSLIHYSDTHSCTAPVSLNRSLPKARQLNSWGTKQGINSNLNDNIGCLLYSTVICRDGEGGVVE